MAEEQSVNRSEILALTTEIVSAHVSNNTVVKGDLPQFIQSVFDRLNALASEDAAPVELTPAVPIKRSVTDDYLICLEDGKKLKMLKRHLMTAYGMTPEAYRARWGLKPTTDGRAELRAEAAGAGEEDRARPQAARRPAPPAPKPKRGRGKAAAA